MLIAFYSLIALLFGSFTNVLIYRAAKNLSFVSPGSFCPECKKHLPWLEKIPFLSYLFLGGKCKNCKTKISIMYPIVELAIPLLSFRFILKAASEAELIQKLSTDSLELITAQSLNFLNFLFLVTIISITVALAMIDQKYKILPHSLTYLGIVIGVIFVSFNNLELFKNFTSSYYENSIIFSEIFGGYLAGLLSSLMQLGLVFFSLDVLTHFANKIYYKKNALPIGSSGLTLGIKSLENNITIVYLVLIIIILSLLLGFQDLILHYFFVLLGASYLINEIFRDYFFNKARNQTEDLIDQRKTVLGGGDVAMIGLIAVIFGVTKTLLIVLSGFYLLFVFLMFKFIKIFFETAFNKETETKVDGLELLKDNLARHIPVGGALSVSFIAAMMIFS